MRSTIISAILGLGIFALVACDAPLVSPRPEKRTGTPVVKPTPVPPASARSERLRAYYNTVQASLLSQGLLRTDRGGPDTPINKRMLVENFVQIGVYNELTPNAGGQFDEARSEGRVLRWDGPVRVSLMFGPRVTPLQRATDRATVGEYADRLSRLTGLPVTRSNRGANFHVAVLDADDIAGFTPDLVRLIPDIPASLARQITTMPRDTYCAVYTFTERGTPNKISTALAIVRAEHPPLIRQSCFHEEIAQGFGLSNDSPAARPSIFNDDNEFALLTRHDALLLQILYDKRLPVGATPAQARPVANIIAAGLLGGES